jgi:hypothetical protein
MDDLLDKPWQDPIVAEVRSIREGLFAAAGFDIGEFCRQLQSRQAVSGRTIVKKLPERPVNEAA